MFLLYVGPRQTVIDHIPALERQRTWISGFSEEVLRILVTDKGRVSSRIEN
jgi:hypothetical protein